MFHVGSTAWAFITVQLFDVEVHPLTTAGPLTPQLNVLPAGEIKAAVKDICLVGGILTEQVPVSDVPEYEQLNPLPIYSALL